MELMRRAGTEKSRNDGQTAADNTGEYLGLGEDIDWDRKPSLISLGQ